MNLREQFVQETGRVSFSKDDIEFGDYIDFLEKRIEERVNLLEHQIEDSYQGQ